MQYQRNLQLSGTDESGRLKTDTRHYTYPRHEMLYLGHGRQVARPLDREGNESGIEKGHDSGESVFLK